MALINHRFTNDIYHYYLDWGIYIRWSFRLARCAGEGERTSEERMQRRR